MSDIVVRMVTASEYARDAQDIWLACFPEDDRAFTNYYFDCRTQREYVLGAFTDGRMVGMLHMIPQRIMLFDAVKDIGFVAGVATLPQYRRRGVAAAMLRRAEELMRNRGFCAAVLQPFDVGFYQKFGYVPFVRRRVYELDRMTCMEGGLHEPDAMELFRLYTRFAVNYNGMAVRSAQNCEALLREREAGAGFLSTGSAYAMYYPGEVNRVMELCGDEAEFPALLRGIAKTGPVSVPVPLDISLEGKCDERVFNMLLPLDMEALLSGLPVSFGALVDGEVGVNYSFESY